ncbi:MAG: hypothetical protein AAF692_02815 [Pseudomonadota bacterium]
MKFFDRLLTIVITATLTSAFWIVFGTAIMQAAEDKTEADAPSEEAPVTVTEPAPTAPTAPTLEVEPAETEPEPAPIAPPAPVEAEPTDSPSAAPNGASSEAKPETETEEAEAGA